MLLNAADIDLDSGDANRAASALAESRQLLESALPQDKNPSEAWRYAIWDSVHSKLLAERGDREVARRIGIAAVPIIEKRWGPNGFHTLLARRRAHVVEQHAAGH